MKVCFICNQIASWGKIGGFGTATRAIGAGLAKRGVEVVAVVPRRQQQGQRDAEQLDGITVYGTGSWETMTSGRIFREIDADIYHSQEPTVASRLAQLAVPEKVHIVTCRDPRGIADHFVELNHTNVYRRLIFPVTWYYEVGPHVKRAVRNATKVFRRRAVSSQPHSTCVRRCGRTDVCAEPGRSSQQSATEGRRTDRPVRRTLGSPQADRTIL